MWRLDSQLGWGIDRDACVRPEHVEPLVRGMLGPDVDFTEEWYSVYTLQCRRMARFAHGRVIFAGDSAHLVSPFGARGCNGDVADADNLGWKLDLVLTGGASAALLDSYDHEALVTADVNIANAWRSSDFMTPRTPASRGLRDAVPALASDCAFARPLVNSGRRRRRWPIRKVRSTPPTNAATSGGGVAPGEVLIDAATARGCLLERTGGGFCLLANGWAGPAIDSLRTITWRGNARRSTGSAWCPARQCWCGRTSM